MRTPGSWPEQSGDRRVAMGVGAGRCRRNRAGGGLRGQRAATPVRRRRRSLAELLARGASDRRGSAVSSARHGAGDRSVPAAAGAALRGACGGVRGQPGGDRAGGDRGQAARPPVGRPRLLRGLLRQPGDARADGGGARASGVAVVACGSVSRVGGAALGRAGCVVHRAGRRPGRGVCRWSPLGAVRRAGCRWPGTRRSCSRSGRTSRLIPRTRFLPAGERLARGCRMLG